MARDPITAARELCLAFPETEEVESRGSPNFRVAGKTFAILAVNHHGDGRVALWLDSPPGSQQLYSEMQPEHYFVPPYVGPKGWLGVELNRDLDWQAVIDRVQESWTHRAPPALQASPAATPVVPGPEALLSPEQIDPFLGPRAQAVLTRLGELCSALPEAHSTRQFGSPVWKAGKKTFVSTAYRDERLQLQFRVGASGQSLLELDERYSIPPYIGGNGWINLDVEDYADWPEIEALALESYRHHALKRMLKALEDAP